MLIKTVQDRQPYNYNVYDFKVSHLTLAWRLLLSDTHHITLYAITATAFICHSDYVAGLKTFLFCLHD